ncbi:hypothetical protein ACFL6Y_04015 [Elusimicrobiota bacterium]
MKIFSLIIMSVFLTGCAATTTKVTKKGDIAKTIDQESVRKKYIEAIGIGAADTSLTNATQRKATSRNAAIVAAQYEMLSMIKGLQLEGGITVEKAIETDSMLQTRIDAVIKGAEIKKSEWTNDDGCVVTLQLDKKRLQEMMGIKFK